MVALIDALGADSRVSESFRQANVAVILFLTISLFFRVLFHVCLKFSERASHYPGREMFMKP